MLTAPVTFLAFGNLLPYENVPQKEKGGFCGLTVHYGSHMCVRSLYHVMLGWKD